MSKHYTEEEIKHYKELGYSNWDIKVGLAERLEDMTDWRNTHMLPKDVYTPCELCDENDLFLGFSTAKHPVNLYEIS